MDIYSTSPIKIWNSPIRPDISSCSCQSFALNSRDNHILVFPFLELHIFGITWMNYSLSRFFVSSQCQ